MAALTTDLTEVEADFSRVAAEVSRTGKPVIVLKSYEPWVIPQSANNLTETQMRPRHSASASAFRRGQPHLLPKNARVRVLGLAQGNEGIAIANLS